MPVYLFRTFVSSWHNLKTLHVNILQCWKLVKILLIYLFLFYADNKKDNLYFNHRKLKKKFRALFS